jgi:hypothetical protein
VENRLAFEAFENIYAETDNVLFVLQPTKGDRLGTLVDNSDL